MTATDPTMTAITDAVTRGRAGDGDGARIALTDLWAGIGPHGDPFHRCTLAHYLADLHDDPAQALAWDIRALDAAEALTDSRAREFDDSLDVRGFFPSLHLNLADNYRRLASFDAARQQVDAARRHLHALPDDAYGAMIRTALDEVEASISSGTTARRESAPTGRPVDAASTT
ncbi:hypothetical protein GV794_19100 [Nocardia cyriacigeorgica]|uniref:Tetratricopeptide repeat protein n=1 Tax=Nocardia cyriacigeorgica TaxID=135487 RepID=A0A6P1DBN4_9NOCA|nr:hypothetical protein [Nocardia cyriacigeorgica]NEW40062.1 hypothetical protein [Nocardia cyriacigeorgica]NEW48146.1 hypothetical protein [Nocardia cyriacigeorgica]NEW51612.1 hypothetical protein [Nocardia cyriacigeorgica]NEW57749.1 hypothetical protein [Nocardia cyriacigeorgica]